MIINHPLLGPRDSQEFVYLGDAALMHRPDGMAIGKARDQKDPDRRREQPRRHQRHIQARSRALSGQASLTGPWALNRCLSTFWGMPGAAQGVT